nr:MAG: putative tegument protein UL37 [Ardenna herpesvirus]
MAAKNAHKNALAEIASELSSALKSARAPDSEKNLAPKFTSLLADLLLSRDEVSLEDLEAESAKPRLAEGVFAACKLVPSPVAEVVIRLALRAIMRRVVVPWQTGDNFAMIQRVREAFRELVKGFERASEKELNAPFTQCSEYKDLIGGWLTQFGSAVVRTISEQQLLEDSRSTMNPSEVLAQLVERYPLLVDHTMVQDGMDYLGGKLQNLVAYHALFQCATQINTNPKVPVLAALTMIAEYFDPATKPAYRKVPQKAVAAFDLNLTEEVVKSLVYDQAETPGALCEQPAFQQNGSLLFAEAVSSRNMLALVQSSDTRESSDAMQKHGVGGAKRRKQQAQQSRGAGLAWRCGLDALFSVPLEHVAMNVPAVLHMLYEPPSDITAEYERALSLYATGTVDAIAKFQDLAASLGLEAVIRSLALRGFTKSNCEQYLFAAEAFLEVQADGSPLKDFYAAVIYASVVGLAAHSLYAYNQHTVSYPERYARVLKETIETHAYLLNMVGLTEGDVLIPLRAFAPQPSDQAFRTVRDTLAAVVDSAEGGAEEFSDLVVSDYVQRLTADFCGDVQENAQWLNDRDAAKRHRRGLATSDNRETAASTWRPALGLRELAELVQGLQIGGEEPEALGKHAAVSVGNVGVGAVFSSLFAASVVWEVMDGAAALPFEADALARLNKVLSWLRDFGLSWNMPDSSHYRRRIMALQATIHPFISGKTSVDAVTVKQVQALEGALEELHSACEYSFHALPQPYVEGLRKIPAPSRRRSPLLAKAYTNAAVGDLSALTETLNKDAEEISAIIKTLVSRLLSVRDLFSRQVSVDGTNVTIGAVSHGGPKLGTWNDESVITGLWKTVNFAEAAIRNTERVVRKLEVTKKKTQDLEESYCQLASDYDDADPQSGGSLYKQVATELVDIADARDTVINMSRSLYRTIASTGLKRIRDFVKAWRLFLKAEQGLAKQGVHQQDLLEALGAVAFVIEASVAQQSIQDYDESGWRNLEAKYGVSGAERDLAVAEMLGPQTTQSSLDRGGASSASSTKTDAALITASSDVKSWDKTNKAPLTADYSFSEQPPREYEKLIPERLISSEETLKLSDRILSSKGEDDAEEMYEY